MLGFGLGDAVELLTPAALAIVSSVLTFLVAEMTKATKAESASLIQERVRQLFKKFQPSVNNPANNAAVNQQGKQRLHLTTEQLTQIRAIALKQAQQMKLSETRAKMLADAIVGSLVITTGV